MSRKGSVWKRYSARTAFPDKTWQLFYLVFAFDLDSGKQISVFDGAVSKKVFQVNSIKEARRDVKEDLQRTGGD